MPCLVSMLNVQPIAEALIHHAERGITRLPEEVLLQIFNHLRPALKLKGWRSCGIDANLLYQCLAQVCRVNKLFRRIVTPLLYHTVDLPSGSPGESTLSAASHPKLHGCKNTKLFFRSILDDCSLTGLVRSLKIEYHGRLETSHYVGCDDRSSSFLEPLISAPCSMLPLSEEVRTDIKSRALVHYDDAILALLVPLCVNLKYLDLTFYEQPQEFANSLLVRSVEDIARDAAITGRLAKLQTLKLRYNRSATAIEATSDGLMRETFHLADVAAFLRLPRLKDVRIRGLGCTGWPSARDIVPTLEPSLSRSVVSMHLNSSTLDGREIAEALAAFPKLTEFKYTQREVHDLTLDHAPVFEALRSHSRKLKVLQFHASNTGGAPGDLKPLKRLKELSISQRSLLGSYDPDIPLEELPEFTDILPESLTKVKIIPFRRSYPPMNLFAPPPTQEEMDAPEHALTDFGEAFDHRIVRLCGDARFGTLGKVTLRRADEIEVGLVPPGWTPEVDDTGMVRLRRGEVVVVDEVVDPFADCSVADLAQIITEPDEWLLEDGMGLFAEWTGGLRPGSAAWFVSEIPTLSDGSVDLSMR